ncbi:hypothetical protein ACFLZH_05480 [Patescibacteria group bacterium]
MHRELSQNKSEQPSDSYKIETEELQRLMQLTPAQLAEHFIQLEHTGELNDFLREALKNEAFKAHISYYQKWIEMSLNKENRLIIDDIIKSQQQEVSEVIDELPLGLEHKFNEDELQTILNNLNILQLTYGCHGKCGRCGFDAVSNAREHMPFKQVKNLLEKYGGTIKQSLLTNNRKFCPYYASDPTEYYKIDEALDILDKHIGLDQVFYTTRKLPSDKTSNKLSGVEKKRMSVNFGVEGRGVRVFTKASFERAEQLEEKGKESGFGNFVDGSNKQILGTSFQIPNPSGLSKGIGAKDGILLSPRGIYSLLYTGPATPKYPQGGMVIPFEGFDVPKGKERIREGQNLGNYLSHGIVLKRLQIIPEGVGSINRNTKYEKYTFCFFLYNNQIHKINYRPDGIILSSEVVDQNNIEQGKDEQEKEYKSRLIAFYNGTSDEKRKKEILKKLDKLK